MYIGLFFACATGIWDLISVLRGAPLIPHLNYTFVFGTVVWALTYLWTFLSQYSWILSALGKYENQISELLVKSNKNFIELIQLIAKTIETKDKYTAGHSLRVMDYATRIARSLNLSEKEIEMLKHACLLHDIGKIGIPETILNKKTPLTSKERTYIQSHPVFARQILSTVSDFQDILEIIYTHHERVDGNGYPEGLKHAEIPLLARIVAVADAYDAMLSERPYRKAKSKKQAIHELQNVKDTQLDGLLVDKFIEVLID
jgi:putative nucleotidyltransferase with HDIG domain